MTNDITLNSLTATIPALGDNANIVTAFTDYHTDIAPAVAVLARTNTFTQNNTFSGDIAVNGGDITSTASTLSIGQTATTATTINLGTAAASSGITKTLNLGTGGQTASITNVNIGPGLSAQSSNINLNGKVVVGSGTVSGNPTAGTVEYDGKVFYATPKVNNTTAGRGLLPAQNLFILYNSNTAPTVTSTSGTVTSEFYAFGKSLYLDSSTKYFVEMSIKVFHNISVSVSGNGSVVFFLKGQANTGHEINAQSQVDMASYATSTTPTFEFLSGLGAGTKTIKSVSGVDTGYSIFNWSGIVSPGTSGSFGPGLNLTAQATGGMVTTAVTVASGSWCKITPMPNYSAADVNIGGWA